jgi:phage head maturation protease
MRREAQAIISSGAMVPHREYHNPVYLNPTGVDLSRANDGEVPLLSAHDPEKPVGFVVQAWRSKGLLKATLRFDSTLDGRAAFEQLESGEVRGVSVGSFTRSDDITVVDRNGRESDFDEKEWRQYWQDPASILHVKRWTLLEVSMVEKPADKFAVARPISHEARRIRRRMQAQQRSLDRDDDDDGLLLRAIMPSSRQILHGSPELIHVRQAEDRQLVFYGD